MNLPSQYRLPETYELIAEFAQKRGHFYSLTSVYTEPPQERIVWYRKGSDYRSEIHDIVIPFPWLTYAITTEYTTAGFDFHFHNGFRILASNAKPTDNLRNLGPLPFPHVRYYGTELSYLGTMCPSLYSGAVTTPKDALHNFYSGTSRYTLFNDAIKPFAEFIEAPGTDRSIKMLGVGQNMNIVPPILETWSKLSMDTVLAFDFSKYAKRHLFLEGQRLTDDSFVALANQAIAEYRRKAYTTLGR